MMLKETPVALQVHPAQDSLQSSTHGSAAPSNRTRPPTSPLKSQLQPALLRPIACTSTSSSALPCRRQGLGLGFPDRFTLAAGAHAGMRSTGDLLCSMMPTRWPSTNTCEAQANMKTEIDESLFKLESFCARLRRRAKSLSHCQGVPLAPYQVSATTSITWTYFFGVLKKHAS